MSKMFPIIRRKRRPLYVEDVPTMPTKIKPVQSVAEKLVVEPAKRKKADDAEITANTTAP